MDRPGRNEPCHCGSGRKYKHCHLAVDNATPERRYAESQRAYAANWVTVARAQHARGDYAWMAERLSPFGVGRILDVGCGAGHGLLAMLSVLGSDLRIVAIDENPSCLGLAHATLAQAGFPHVGVVDRLTTMPRGEMFEQVAAPFTAPLPRPVALVGADVCSDEHLERALAADGPFDAVTVWLTGTHGLRQRNLVVARAGVDSDQAHRLFVQNNAYELADRVLRSGGVLQVVDRRETPSTDLLRDDMLRSHTEQAEPTSLRVTSLADRSWTSPGDRRVPMVITPGLSGRKPGSALSLVSVVSVKG